MKNILVLFFLLILIFYVISEGDKKPDLKPKTETKPKVETEGEEEPIDEDIPTVSGHKSVEEILKEVKK